MNTNQYDIITMVPVEWPPQLRSMIVALAWRYYRRARRRRDIVSVDVRDICQAGIIAAYYAMQDYDPDRGVAITTYVYPYIVSAMRDAVETEAMVRNGIMCRHNIDGDYCNDIDL